MDKEDTDVQEESSPSEEQVVETVESKSDNIVIQEEEQEVEAKEEVEEPKEEPKASEEPKEKEEAPKEEAKREEPRIPLSRLRQEAQKRKALEKELEEFRNKPKEQPVQQPDASKPVPPRLSEVGYDEEKFSEAMADYQDKLVDWKLEKRDTQRKQQFEQERVSKLQEEHQNRLQKFYDSNAEYQKVLEEVAMMEEEIHYPPAVAHAISISEDGPELDFFILKNRETILPKLAQMSPEQQLLYVGGLRATSSAQPKPVAPAKSTSAPPPIETHSGGSASHTDVDSVLREKFGGKFILK